MAGILEKRLSNKKQSDKAQPVQHDDNILEEVIYEDELDGIKALEELISEESYAKERKKKKKKKIISTCFLSIGCVYLIVMIFGVIITDYEYNAEGEVAPIVLSVTDIEEKDEYIKIAGMYIQTRSLYETLLALDYRMAMGIEDPLTIAPEYEESLDTVSRLGVQIDASQLTTKYNQVKNMLITWIQTHAAAYCQYMSKAISQNDSNAAKEAIAAREVVKSEFQKITQNIITYGENIRGYDLTEIKNWDPDTYIKQTMEGLE